VITRATTSHHDAPTSEQGDDDAADYDAYVAHQESELTKALAAANDAVHRASRALFELTELDAPEWTQTTEGEDATAALTEAGHAIRAANRCAHLAAR
jgi:hypothetical protein